MLQKLKIPKYPMVTGLRFPAQQGYYDLLYFC